MRNLMFLGLLLVAASMAGWFQISRQGDRTTIEIDRAEIRQDAQRAIERGREFLDANQEQYVESESFQPESSWPQEQVANQDPLWNQNENWQIYPDPAYNQGVPQQTYPQQQNYQPNTGPYYPQQPYYGPVTR